MTSTPSPSDAERLGVTDDVAGALRLLAMARQQLRHLVAAGGGPGVVPGGRSAMRVAQQIGDLIGDPGTGTPGTFRPAPEPVELEALVAGPPVVLGWPMGLRHRADLEHLPKWPAGWPPPAVGDAVTFRTVADDFTVHAVHWFPEGEDDADPEPGVYVVLRRLGDH